MQTTYEDLIHQLGIEMNVDLEPDLKNSVSLVLDGKITIQIEPDKYENRLIVGVFIITLPPGKFRENILKEALKQNTLPSQTGVFAYNDILNQLLFFCYVPLEKLDGKKLFEFLVEVIAFIEPWQKAIESGKPGPIEPSLPKDKKRPFDL
jgi:hypothetical protein